MTKYKELVYMVLDKVKGSSDDFYYTEDHIIFLLNKYRNFLLKQRYSDIKKAIPASNYQTIEVELEMVDVFDGIPCTEGIYLRSVKTIPYTLTVGTTKVYPKDYFKGHISFINRDKFRYVSFNKYTKNIIYSTIAPDNYLYLKSCNAQYEYLEKVNITGIFENPTDLFGDEDIMEQDFPIEEALVPPLLELVSKELLGSVYKPEDNENNATDDLANIAAFLRKNVKSDLQKQIES